MAQLAEAKIGLGDFFTEVTYKDANNQERPCFQITKKGCEFIAHKLTGQKGTEFNWIAALPPVVANICIVPFIFGSLATLIGAVCTWKLRGQKQSIFR